MANSNQRETNNHARVAIHCKIGSDVVAILKKEAERLDMPLAVLVRQSLRKTANELLYGSKIDKNTQPPNDNNPLPNDNNPLPNDNNPLPDDTYVEYMTPEELARRAENEREWTKRRTKTLDLSDNLSDN